MNEELTEKITEAFAILAEATKILASVLNELAHEISECFKALQTNIFIPLQKELKKALKKYRREKAKAAFKQKIKRIFSIRRKIHRCRNNC